MCTIPIDFIGHTGLRGYRRIILYGNRAYNIGKYRTYIELGYMACLGYGSIKS